MNTNIISATMRLWVRDLYKLYPKIINQQLINRALVEAELRITAKGSAGD